MEFYTCLEKFKEDHQLRLMPRTLRSYIYTINQFQEFIKKPVDRITKKDIRKWLLALKKKGYKRNTIYEKLNGLKAFYKYCLEENIIDVDPVANIPFPKPEERPPRYLTKIQLARLREHLEGRLLERAVLEVLFATGMRISELIAMKKEDINWSERSIRIPEGKFKRGRIVLFNHECAEHLKTYLDSRSDKLPYVFVNGKGTAGISYSTLEGKFQSYSKHVGFKVTPHMLRHSFAAHLAQKGMPLAAIQQLLGHDTPHTTQLYAKLFNEARKEIYDKWQ